MSRKVWFVPELTPENTPFWTGGGQGKLLIMHCDCCDHAIHPPELICPRCLCREVSPQAAEGTGSIYSVTMNFQKWFPDMEVPYAIAVVDLDGEAGVRITAQVVGTAPEDVAIGDRVRVRFEPAGDNIWIPQVELTR